MSDDFTLAKLLDIQLQKHTLPALYDTLLWTFLENREKLKNEWTEQLLALPFSS